MSESDSEQPITISAEERPHPAIRSLARACIALAQLRVAAQQTQKHDATPASADAGEDDRDD